MPLHAALAEEVAVKHQSRPLEAPAAANDRLAILSGHPQLLRIYMIEPDLALELKAMLDLIEDADFSGAQTISQSITHRLRLLDLNTRCDAEGVAR